MDKENKKYVVDTSALIKQEVSKLIEDNKIKENSEILIPKVVILELEHQANSGSILGYLGFEEIEKLYKISKEKNIKVKTIGKSIIQEEFIKLAKKGAIDALIRDYALEENATLITADRVQAIAAKSMGLEVIYVGTPPRTRIDIDKLFDEETMSVHLKVGSKPLAKKGTPANWKLVEISNEILTEEDFNHLVSQILARVSRGEGVIESKRKYSMVIQLGKYRIVIIWPPLSEAHEITIVKPLVKKTIWDYKLPSSVLNRLLKKAEGILISGAPGAGKSTFTQALAEFYLQMGKIIKTIEHPRDLNLPIDVTQLSKNYARIEELYELLLLSRPDYTFFDEMRTDEDFNLYVDLRLAGIGMVGVIHASSPIDAIQRFINRIELGMIPSIIDTVIFLEKGNVKKVYELTLTVKVPTGMRDEDLARPVVEVRDFINGKLEYEIYTFGEQTVVMPVEKIKKKRRKRR